MTERRALWGSEELADLYHRAVEERNALRRAVDSVLAHLDSATVVDVQLVRTTLRQALGE